MTTAATAAPANPYLDDFLAPVHAEVTATDLAVTGHIPEFLDGRYLRNGPNPVAEVDPATYHWFTGDGMVHGVALQDGKAGWYRNRWVRTPVSVRRPWANRCRAERNLRAGHAVRWAPTPTCWRTPEDPGSRRRRRGQLRTHRRARHGRARATSTAPWPAAIPLIRTVTRKPANCTRCPIRSRAVGRCSIR